MDTPHFKRGYTTTIIVIYAKKCPKIKICETTTKMVAMTLFHKHFANINFEHKDVSDFCTSSLSVIVMFIITG